MMQPEVHTLRDLSAPNVDQQPLCIIYPATTCNLEVKSGLIHLLPTFSRHAGEDPQKHLKEFHIVCDRMIPYDVAKEQMNLRAFPFSLKEDTKD